jgi:hypothetical protein
MRRCLGVLILSVGLFLSFLPSSLSAEEPLIKIDSSGYVGSKFSLKYHRPWCRKALKIQEQNRISFSDGKDAFRQGYMPCPRCKPPSQD